MTRLLGLSAGDTIWELNTNADFTATGLINFGFFVNIEGEFTIRLSWNWFWESLEFTAARLSVVDRLQVEHWITSGATAHGGRCGDACSGAANLNAICSNLQRETRGEERTDWWEGNKSMCKGKLPGGVAEFIMGKLQISDPSKGPQLSSRFLYQEVPILEGNKIGQKFRRK